MGLLVTKSVPAKAAGEKGARWGRREEGPPGYGQGVYSRWGDYGHGVRRSGDGFVTLADGSLRWGVYGAAGVLTRHVDAEGLAWYFLARRSLHTHQGGTWAVPGGAMDHGEDPVAAALREFAEEIGPFGANYEVVEVHEDDHGGWAYWTVVVDVPKRFPVPASLGWETAEARWVAAAELAGIELFGAFRATLVRMGILEP